MSYNSKYTGKQVEDLLDKIEDLENRPSITEQDIADMGFTKNKGTITQIKMNGVVKGTNDIVDLGTVITAHQDISGKQDIISDIDQIRKNANKGATALQSVPSEYVTETELVNKGYATTQALNTKVDKVNGKQLSTEDFTSALKAKLEGLNNYNDTAISTAISSLQTQLDTLVSGNASDAINSFNEIIAFLDTIKDDQDLSSIIASIEQQIAAKQNKITDLDTIRNGAALGATALQSYTEKYTGTYSKPSTGIPKIDLSNDVQESLTKADNALQEETYKGTVTTSNTEDNNATIGDISTREVKDAVDLETDSLIYFSSHAKATYMNNGVTVEDAINDKIDSVKINGIVTKPLNGMVDLGTVITEHQDISDKLNKTEASENYLTKTDAQTMYLGKTEKASDSISADTAIQAIKDSDGNVIISTYATKDSIPANASKRISDLENGTSSMPIILLAGTIYRSSSSLTNWYFTGSRHSAITSENPTATVNGGVIRFQFNAVDGRSIYFVSVTANVQATGEANSYTSTEYRVRSGGANWLYTYSTANYLYIRGWHQHNQYSDSAESSALQWDGTAADGITRISIIAVGYAY